MRVLARLREQDGPVRADRLAAELAQHANTVREHLDELVSHGLARRHAAPAQGRGRPAWLYEPAPISQASPLREYADLVAVLAEQIARTSRDPGGQARAAGTSWGRRIAAARPRASGSPRAARQAAVEVMADLGFDPVADARFTTASLRRCPLLDVARRHPEIVCEVHLGIVQAVVSDGGGDPSRTALIPFAEPGSCRLELLTRPLSG